MASDDELRARIAALEREVSVLHAMLRSTPDLISRTTVDGKFLYLNHVTPGFRMEDVVGTPAEAYIPEAFHARLHAAMRAAQDTRATQ